MNVSTARFLSKAMTTLVPEGVMLLYGQARSSLPHTVTEVFAKANAHTEAIVVSMAEAMPEHKYSFVPTNGEFKGVRTFAQLVKHVAADNYVDAAALLRKTPPIDVGEHENGPDSIRTKAEILRFVRDSFEYMQKAIRTVNQENLMERLEFPGAPGGIPRLMIVNAAMAHPWDIYGQMIEYLRMNGIDPQAKH
ncbi:MAG TPA: DinB family protein [Terriglobales bacterium]|nr:DinB family protein [Terriglobales bacterium]